MIGTGAALLRIGTFESDDVRAEIPILDGVA
jgi:hypothetical protein